MARPKQSRRMVSPPRMIGFRPYGVAQMDSARIELHYDEYEAIRLLDYEGMTQEQAAEQMNVSRPTLTRIYENARRTIAKAFVEGNVIVIEGGNVDFGRTWYRCRRCHKLFDCVDIHRPCKNCRNYGNEELIPIGQLNE